MYYADSAVWRKEEERSAPEITSKEARFDVEAAWTDVLERHPEWKRCVIRGSRSLVFLMPSGHPTFHEPLTISIRRLDVVVRFRIQWGRYYEDVHASLAWKGHQTAFEEVIQRLEEWISDDYLLVETGHPADRESKSRVRIPIPAPPLFLRQIDRRGDEGEHVIARSWRGTHDIVYEITPNEALPFV